EKGHREGREDGLKEGLEEGLRQGKEQIARSLLREGVDIDVIARTTGLDREMMEKLRPNE
ncbi:ISNCY family transposase, partial [Candidatus Poribacteria bacterium]|nr:ISNCY family transposase [Candidatus Poribacteria bacterium]